MNREFDTFALPPSEQRPLVHRRAKRTKETMRTRFKNETRITKNDDETNGRTICFYGKRPADINDTLVTFRD